MPVAPHELHNRTTNSGSFLVMFACNLVKISFLICNEKTVLSHRLKFCHHRHHLLGPTMILLFHQFSSFSSLNYWTSKALVSSPIRVSKNRSMIHWHERRKRLDLKHNGSTRTYIVFCEQKLIDFWKWLSNMTHQFTNHRSWYSPLG